MPRLYPIPWATHIIGGQSGSRDPREDTAHCWLNPFKAAQQPQTAHLPLGPISLSATLDEVFGFTRDQIGSRDP